MPVDDYNGSSRLEQTVWLAPDCLFQVASFMLGRCRRLRSREKMHDSIKTMASIHIEIGQIRIQYVHLEWTCMILFD